jgi:hypothetical protein
VDDRGCPASGRHRPRAACGGCRCLDRIAEQSPPAREVDLDELADLFTTVFEGGFVMAKSLNEPRLIARHVAHYRSYVELLFAPRRTRSRVDPTPEVRDSSRVPGGSAVRPSRGDRHG